MLKMNQWNIIQLSVDNETVLNDREILSDSKSSACYKVKVTIKGRSCWGMACDPRVSREISTAIDAKQPANSNTTSENHIAASSSSPAGVSLSTEAAQRGLHFIMVTL